MHRQFVCRNRFADRSIVENGRNGLTLVEVLVTIAIIGILFAIILPAVQHSRVASRRLQCTNRLKALGVALTNYDSIHSKYPESYKWRVQLLPHIGESALGEQFAKFDRWVSGDDEDAPPQWELTIPVEQFICPSDSHRGKPIVNYYGNMGTGLQAYGFNGFIIPAPGGVYYHGAYDVRHTFGPSNSSSVTDGLSNTAALSEALSGDFTLHPSANEVSHVGLLRTLWDRGAASSSRADDFLEFRRICATVREWGASPIGGIRGHFSWPKWSNGDGYVGPIVHGWAYDHALPPNSPSCGSGYYGIYSANSIHGRGANLVFGDGHSQFISEEIDEEVWSALGTRNGNEVVDF